MNTKSPTTTGGSIRPTFRMVAAVPQPQKRFRASQAPMGMPTIMPKIVAMPATWSDIHMTS